LASAKRLRSKLNRAVEAPDVKLAASKTALGLHPFSSFLEIVQTTIETCKKISTGVLKAIQTAIEHYFVFVKNFFLRIKQVCYNQIFPASLRHD
jgi:hypothetical protein